MSLCATARGGREGPCYLKKALLATHGPRYLNCEQCKIAPERKLVCRKQWHTNRGDAL